MRSLGTFRPRPPSRVARGHRILPAASLLVVALGLIAMSEPTTGSARDAFVAGGRATAPLPLDDGAAARAVERAGRVAAALGLPEGARHATRLADRFEGGIVDEVVTLDAAGRPSAIERFTPDGRLRLALRLGWPEPQGSIAADRAAAVALRMLDAAGIRPAGERSVRGDAGGWTIAWIRSAGGSPVRGDGTTVRLWADGSIHSIAVMESPLAPAPAAPIAATEARRIVGDLVAVRAAATGVQPPSISAADLAWVAPNDLLEPGLPDAPSAERRLAWVIRLDATGALAERYRAYELFVDAGDGRPLGGDILE